MLEREIEDHPSALCFLDPEGFRYYLPAYMRWSVRNYRTSNSLSSEGLAKPLAYRCGTGILPVFHGRDAHATRGFARASSDMTIYALASSGNKGVTDWNRARWEVFTRQQSEVILDYLRFMLETGKDHADSFMAELAINAYWRQFG